MMGDKGERPARGQIWNWLVWLVPLSFMVPIALGVWSITSANWSNLDFMSGFAVVFLAGTVAQMVVLFAISIGATALAMTGRTNVAQLTLAALGAVVLSSSFWPGLYAAPYSLLLALPGAVAVLIALAGLLLQWRRVHWLLSLAVVALLLVPVVSFAASRQSAANYFANDCPPGPAVDLTFSGLESGHYTRSCGLPLSGRELTGCTNGSVTVGLLAGNNLTGNTVWHLTLPAHGQTRVSSDENRAAPSLLVGQNKSYGGSYGWRGYYVFDSACSGNIDADLASIVTDRTGRTYLGPGPPVHVRGHFAAPPGYR